MKGYARVSTETLRTALNVRNAKKDRVVKIRERAVEECANDIRYDMNFIVKFFKRNKTDNQLVFGENTWGYHRYWKLKNYVNDTEYNLLNWYYAYDSLVQGAAIRNLLDAAEEDYVMLDDDLCEFIKLNKETFNASL